MSLLYVGVTGMRMLITLLSAIIIVSYRLAKAKYGL